MAGERVLLVGADGATAPGLRRALLLEGYRVTLLADPACVARLLAEWPPDLLIVDADLPDVDGFELLRELRERDAWLPVVVATARTGEADRVYGFHLGADDVVAKPYPIAELLARVRRLLRREAALAERYGDAHGPPPLVAGALVVDLRARQVLRDGARVALSPKEYAVLDLLVRNAGCAVSREELAHRIWGRPPDVVARTVDQHVLLLRRKLEADPARPRHLRTVARMGYRFDP